MQIKNNLLKRFNKKSWKNKTKKNINMNFHKIRE